MTSNKFAEILAELDATLKKLEQAHDVKERRNILLTLRLLIKEADQFVENQKGQLSGAEIMRATVRQPPEKNWHMIQF